MNGKIKIFTRHHRKYILVLSGQKALTMATLMRTKLYLTLGRADLPMRRSSYFKVIYNNSISHLRLFLWIGLCFSWIATCHGFHVQNLENPKSYVPKKMELDQIKFPMFKVRPIQSTVYAHFSSSVA